MTKDEIIDDDAEVMIGVVTFDMDAAAKAHTPNFDELPPSEQMKVVQAVIAIVEAGAGMVLGPPLIARCQSISPPPFGFQCAHPVDHTGFHIDDTEAVSWDSSWT